MDALDEVADFDHRIAVRQVIEGLGDVFPGNRLLVTARVAAYAQPTRGWTSVSRWPPCVL